MLSTGCHYQAKVGAIYWLYTHAETHEDKRKLVNGGTICDIRYPYKL